MGVAGSGKTTVGRALADTIGWRFVDADDYHSQENIAKMRRGVPLDDADRAPWLGSLHRLIARALDRREHLVLACSALKCRYRRALSDGLRPVRFVHLTAPEAVLRERLANRPDHFARPNLLATQIADLEPPDRDEALIIDATKPSAEIVDAIRCEFAI